MAGTPWESWFLHELIEYFGVHPYSQVFHPLYFPPFGWQQPNSSYPFTPDLLSHLEEPTELSPWLHYMPSKIPIHGWPPVSQLEW
jgi:hypothetical protein